MLDIIKSNVPSILALISATLVAYIGYRMGKFRDESDLKKSSVDAADGFRDDLMNRLDEANKRIDKKDEIIDTLKEQKQVCESENRKLSWQLDTKTWQIEQQNIKIKEQEDSIAVLKKKLESTSYGN